MCKAITWCCKAGVTSVQEVLLAACKRSVAALPIPPLAAKTSGVKDQGFLNYFL